MKKTKCDDCFQEGIKQGKAQEQKIILELLKNADYGSYIIDLKHGFCFDYEEFIKKEVISKIKWKYQTKKEFTIKLKWKPKS